MKQEIIDRYRRQKKAAVGGVVFFAAFQLVCAVIFGSLCFIPDSPLWANILLGGLAAVCLLMILPALAALKQRFDEIEGGELDEASEY